MVAFLGEHSPALAAASDRIGQLAALGLVVALVAAGWILFSGGSSIAIPEDPCSERPPLVRRGPVKLQPVAMEAFQRAQDLAGRRIEVVQSYRSCAAQRQACVNICGDPGGCAGTCASRVVVAPVGGAIDVTQAMLGQQRVVEALDDAGWCQPLPDSDPGHFSVDGCH